MKTILFMSLGIICLACFVCMAFAGLFMHLATWQIVALFVCLLILSIVFFLKA